MSCITVKHEASLRHPLLRLWPGLLIWLIIFHVGGMVAAAVIATAGGPPAVEPRFYEKAVDWDHTAAQRDVNRALNWQVAWDAVTGEAGASVRITDPAGNPVNDAGCTVEYFHRAHSRARQFAPLKFVCDGLYRLERPLRQYGDHEFRLTVLHDKDTFTHTATVTVREPSELPGS